MAFYWIKTGGIVKRWFSNYVWDIPNTNRKVYLTFDDGPTPEVTEWVLETLNRYDIKATFFCIGNNVEKYPDIFNKVVEDGHAIGNHTFNHINGWKTDNDTYYSNVNTAEECIARLSTAFNTTKLFRPPYGKIKASQAKRIRADGYRIIMWDVLSADFDQAITPDQCLRNVTENTREGSIIIFHDSLKASNNLKYALPKTIEFLKSKGYRFDVVS